MYRRYTPQKPTARTKRNWFKATWFRAFRLLAVCTAMGIVAYLISQGYDGLFAAGLASALTYVAVNGVRG